MVQTVSAKLQLALDFVELEEALALLKKIEPFVDIIEIGTPAIIRYGVDAVREVKHRYPHKPVLADLKIMDAGEGEARLAFEAEADIVTVMAAAHDDTILGALRAAAQFRAQIMADLMSVPAPDKRAQELEHLGCHIVCVHPATDAGQSSTTTFSLVRLLRAHLSAALIAVAGGIDLNNANEACESGADILVVDSAILKAKDQRTAARALHQTCAAQGRR